MKILILGSSGLLGNYLCKFLSKKFNIVNNGLKKRRIDLLNSYNLENFLVKTKPDIIINCTANTNLDNCEMDKKSSYNTNFKTLENTVNILKKNQIKTKIIQISTDQFYNNKNQKMNKETINNIPNYYCKTKYIVEKYCLKNKILVLRTNFFESQIQKIKVFLIGYINLFKKKFFFIR